MTIASKMNVHQERPARRRLISAMLTAALAVGCQSPYTIIPPVQEFASAKPPASHVAWSPHVKAAEKAASASPKAEAAIVQTSNSTAFPTPGSFGRFETAPVLKPIAIQSGDPSVPKPAAQPPQSSTGTGAPPVVVQPAPVPPGVTPLAMPLLDQAVLGGPTFAGDCDLCSGMTRNFGVSADQCGHDDNISARIGGTLSSIRDYTTYGGGIGILEGTKQWKDSNFFGHAGVAAEWIEDHWPVAFTIGGSRLARIRGEEVCDPWIFSATYDGYWDDSIFGTGNELYADQIRLLVGFALRPRWDVGAWGAIGFNRDHSEITIPVAGATPAIFSATRYFNDRVAGYSSFDLNDRGTMAITSVGYEATNSRVFFEVDGFHPIRENLNLFAGLGYTEGGAYDGVIGFEILNGGATKQRRPCAVGDGWAGCKCEPVVDCGDRYRGGWANGTYRSALRVLTPSRARRYLANEYGLLQAPLAPPVAVAPIPGAPAPAPAPAPVPVPVPVPVPGPRPQPSPEPTPTPEPQTDPCPPRLPGHTIVEGRLSQWLSEYAKTH